MYKQFFGLNQAPFNSTLETQFFFESPQHSEALASLVYAVEERKGLVVVTGEVGCGKSLVGQMLTAQIGDHSEMARLNSTHLRCGGDMLQNVCREFQLAVDTSFSTMELLAALEEFLLAQHSKQRPAVLIVDDIQTLDDAHLDQLRLLANLEVTGSKLLQIILMGQRDLHTCLSGPSGKPLRQRVFRSFHLKALSRDLTGRYINHRLSVAGCTTNPFVDDSVDVLHKYTAGIPRLINNLCDNVLLSAFSDESMTIDAGRMSAVIDEMAAMDAAGRKQVLDCEPEDVDAAMNEITNQYARSLEAQVNGLEAASSHTDERIATLEKLSQRIAGQERRLEERLAEVEGKSRELDKVALTLQEQDTALRDRERTLAGRLSELKGMSDRIAQQDRGIAEREARLTEQLREVQRQSEVIVTQDQRLEEKAGFIEKKLTNRQIAFDRELNECKRSVNRRWHEIKQLVVEHVTREKDWSKRLASIDLRLKRFESLEPDLDRIETRMTTTSTKVQSEMTNKVAELTRTLRKHEEQLTATAGKLQSDLSSQDAQLLASRQACRTQLDEHQRLQQNLELRLGRVRQAIEDEMANLDTGLSERLAQIEQAMGEAAERGANEIRHAREQLDGVLEGARHVLAQPGEILSKSQQQMEQVERITAMVQKATTSLQRTIDASIRESKTLHENARGVRTQLEEVTDDAAQVLSDLASQGGKTHKLRDVLREIYEKSTDRMGHLDSRIRDADSILARLPKQWEELRDNAAHPAQLMQELRSVGSTAERNIHEGVIQLTELRMMIDKAERTRKSIEALVQATRRVADSRRKSSNADVTASTGLTQKIAHLQDAVRRVRGGENEDPQNTGELTLGAS
jgi:type II secretory pathway predicted ATPase ExeA/chromosome segregation ATPase